MAVISDNFESGVATQLELSELDDASLLQWVTNPEAAEEYLKRRYGGDQRSLSPGTYDARHLPGKHDQKTHGGGGGGHSSSRIDAKAIEQDLVSGKTVTVHPEDVDDLMAEFQDGPVFNLKHLQVTGAVNKNCYRKNLREIPRSQMPQLPQDVEQIGAFRAKLAEHGIAATLEEVDPRSLVATQNELNAQKVAKIFGSIQSNGWSGDNIMFISREGAVLDGHHRWAAASAAAMAGTPVKMKTVRVDTDIDTLLAIANTVSLAKKTLTRSRVDFGEEPTSPPPDENKPWIWLDGQWYFVVTDTGDGVPEELNFPEPEDEETPRYEPPGTYDARHLPGKHDQKTHGKGGGNVGGVDPDLKVLDWHQVHPFGSAWQESSNLEERAGGVWSESYDGNVSVRQIMRNRNAGRPDMEGVDTDRFWFKYNYKRIEDENGVEGVLYNDKNMAADLRNSATVMQSKLDSAPTIRRPLYRGVKMNRDQLPKAGDSFEHDVASWTDQRDWAAVYANATDDARLGIVGDHAVIYRMVGSKRAANVDNIMGGYQRGAGEHIAAGKYRVRRVTRKGFSVNVEVEQIND